MTASDLKMNNSTKINTAVGDNALTILRLSPADVSRVKIKDIPAHFSSNLQFRNLLNVTVKSATANFPSAAGVLCGSERRCSGMTCPPSSPHPPSHADEPGRNRKQPIAGV